MTGHEEKVDDNFVNIIIAVQSVSTGRECECQRKRSDRGKEVTIVNVTVLVAYFKKRNTDRKRVTV